jgi:hypothetical protein
MVVAKPAPRATALHRQVSKINSSRIVVLLSSSVIWVSIQFSICPLDTSGSYAPRSPLAATEKQKRNRWIPDTALETVTVVRPSEIAITCN